MRYISRLTGKAIKFKNKASYDKHLEELRSQGLLVRERSRKSRPGVCRDDAWRANRNPWCDAAKRFDCPDVPVPKGHVRQKFSLIHPTRGRPIPTRQVMYMWLDYFSKHNDVEYILSIDTDDAKTYMPVMKEFMGKANFRVVIAENKNVVQALNQGAKHATGDVLVYVSDDFECYANWDLDIQRAARDKGTDWFLLVSDGIQTEIATILFVSRGFYNCVGYLYYPEYISMFADPDITELARSRGVLVDARHLLFKHNHRSIGGLPADAVSAAHENGKTWKHGEELFARRKERNFDL